MKSKKDSYGADGMASKSSVISPGTGSGSKPNSGKIKIGSSAPMDKQGLHRKPSGKTLK